MARVGEAFSAAPAISIHGRKFGLLNLGPATSAVRAALLSPASACGVLVFTSCNTIGTIYYTLQTWTLVHIEARCKSRMSATL